jgi:hypothetical protein
MPSVTAADGKVTFVVTEAGSDVRTACRIHIQNEAGQAQRPTGLPFWRDHFVCPGEAELSLPAGSYSFEVERGPEYFVAPGNFNVREDETEPVTVTLKRLVDMSAEGWWPGDLHVHRPVEDIELLMRAEDLHVAPVITWWNNRNLWQDRPTPDEPLRRFDGQRYYHAMAGEDEREGGALLFFQLRKPLTIAGASREHPSPMKFVAEARRQPGVWIDIEKPFWWDVPVWLASGQVDSVGIANNHMCRSQMYETEAWGRPRDAARLPAPTGNGFWTQEVYYHILNCGLRVPPSAGSASGVLPNPVGYNRVYTYLGDRLDYAAWWAALRDGRSFVTNGPMLRVLVDGQMPGHVFTAAAGPLDLGVFIDLQSREPIDRVEIIKDGRIERTVRHDDWSQIDSLGSLRFDASGWFLVRAICKNPKTFRFASTAPYYVEIGDAKRRISRASAQFFLDWVDERIGRVKLDDLALREEVLEHHRRAREFWLARLAMSNAP